MTTNSIDLSDTVTMQLLKAKAITFLMTAVATEGSFNCKEELRLARQVVDDLIDGALSAADQLFDLTKEAS